VARPPTTLTALIEWIKAHPGRFTYNTPATGGSGGSFVETVLDQHLDAATLKTFQTGYDVGKESAWQPGLADLRALNPYV
jgi:putative spermidine/putrescine transport system substrate-binding protein